MSNTEEQSGTPVSMVWRNMSPIRDQSGSYYIEEGRLLYDKGECDCPKEELEHHELYCGIWVLLDLTGLRGFDELINQYSDKEF